jgi:hypothetical protein
MTLAGRVAAQGHPSVYFDVYAGSGRYVPESR